MHGGEKLADMMRVRLLDWTSDMRWNIILPARTLSDACSVNETTLTVGRSTLWLSFDTRYQQ